MNHLRRKIGRIHFIGIGGIGMSGLAEILVRQDFVVSGSDLASSAVTEHLESMGVKVWVGHNAENIGDVQAVVYSSAVASDNPEMVAAREKGIPVIRRAEMLAELMRLKQGVAVAGTHGKTTTTSLVGTVLTDAGLDPTVVVGGVVRGLGTNARLGESELLVAEADEFDRSFLKLTPTLAVITNVEAEHLDTYGNYENLKEAFCRFANSVPFYGAIIVCIDDEGVVELLPQISRPVITYGTSPQADLRAVDVAVNGGISFNVMVGEENLGRVKLPLAGEHNMRNALAAIAVGRELDVPFETMVEALKGFAGVKRRFEQRGEERGVKVVDDYAHHPTEVRATLSAARNVHPGKVVAVFQPHLYSRTQQFGKEFARELLAADEVYITDIYPAREKPIVGVNAEMVLKETKKAGHKSVHYIPRREDVAPQLAEKLAGGELVITLGAGDIYKTSGELLELLHAGEEKR